MSMPVDLRKLIFSQRELKLTFQKFCKDQNINVPDSHIENIDVVDDPTDGLKVILYYTSNNPDTPMRVHLSATQIQEALIGLCQALRIPLPRVAEKHLQKHKDGLALSIGMSENDLRMASGAKKS